MSQAKDKAKELVGRFTLELSPDYYQQEAKQCALICVDEVLNSHIDTVYKAYYLEVKQEIINYDSKR
jgi:hypothetical protein